VTLPAASGAVFTTTTRPVVTAAATFTVPTAPTAASSTAARSTAPSRAATAAAPILRLKVAVLGAGRTPRSRARHVRVSGRLTGARRGRVDIVLRRAGGGSVRRVRQSARRGRFVRTLRQVHPGRYRVAVTYLPRRTLARESVVRRFSVPR
jgi:hypothetical protein